MYINTFGDAMQKRFGKKIYRLSLDGGMTCPNRDGTLGTRGCIFCGEKGGGEFAECRHQSVTKQITASIEHAGKKAVGRGYVAYFQSFTNTYAPLEKLKELFLPAINDDRIDALSVATRPDCLPDDVLSFIGELALIKPVWIELGLQTVHESTAKYIRRGYMLDVYDRAVKNIKNVGAEVVTHIILGLPFETPEMMIESARYAGAVSDGIKLHLLHVLQGSDLYDEYKNGVFDVLSLAEYADILIECIKNIPAETVLHRITGDGDKRILEAPMWSADKKRVMGYLQKRFADCDLLQGSAL